MRKLSKKTAADNVFYKHVSSCLHNYWWKHLYLCHSRNYAVIPSISAGLIPNIWHSWRAMRSVGSQRL